MILSKKTNIYADYASATPMSKRVYKAMEPYLRDLFYNPSALYQSSVSVAQKLAECRSKVASILSARPSEIYFVDGATEANNLALLGVIESYSGSQIPHVITTAIEHASVIEPLQRLCAEGVIELSILGVDESGFLNLVELKKAIKDSTILISIGYANGEIGTLQDIRAVAKIVRQVRKNYNSTYPYFHTDAVQAINYVENINILQLGVDLLTLNAAKIYGPKKIAVLFAKTGVSLRPIILGGNQEGGLRSGTENIAAVVGLTESLVETREVYKKERLSMELLQSYAYELFEKLPGVYINSTQLSSIPNIINITFPKLSHEEIILRLDACGISASVKSACKAGEDGDSHVILALRASSNQNLSTGSVRFSFGRNTRKKDILEIYKQLDRIVNSMMLSYEKYCI